MPNCRSSAKQSQPVQSQQSRQDILRAAGGEDDKAFFRQLFEGFFYPSALTFEGKQNKKLKRGIYNLEGVIGNESEFTGTIRNKEIEIPIDGEPKLVNVKKLTIKEPKMIDGKKGSEYKATIEVLENPIPIVPIIYGLSATGSLTAGWFFVDKVERFSKTSVGSIITILAAMIAVYQFVLKS